MAGQKKTERKSYNNIPETSSLHIPNLPKNEIAKYRLLNVYDPVTRKKKLRTWIAPDEETVMDDSGAIYDIAAIKSQTADGDVQFVPIVFEDGQDSSIEVRGASINEQKIYRRLELSNYNKSNPHRDTTVTPKFERIDLDSDANQQMNNRKQVRQALEIVEHWSDQDIVDYLKATNRPLSKASVNRNAVEEIAEKSPGLIIKSRINTGSNELREEIARLKKEGIILWNKETKKWSAFDDSTILTVKKPYGFDADNELYQYLANKPEALSKVKIAYSELVKTLDQGKAQDAPPAPKAPKK